MMVNRTPYWLRLILGAGILLSLGAANKILPTWLGGVGFALLAAFFVIVIAWALEPVLRRHGLWHSRTGR